MEIHIGGCENLGPKYGLTSKQLFDHPDLQAYQKPHLWDARSLFPFYDYCLESRNEIGLRSFLHTIEKCINPYGARHAILTIHHEPYIERFVSILQKRFTSGLLFWGEEGSCDLSFRKPSKYICVTPDRILEGEYDISELRKSVSFRPGNSETTLKFWHTAIEDRDSKEAECIISQMAVLLLAMGGNNFIFEDNKKQAKESFYKFLSSH